MTILLREQKVHLRRVHRGDAMAVLWRSQVLQLIGKLRGFVDELEEIDDELMTPGVKGEWSCVDGGNF